MGCNPDSQIKNDILQGGSLNEKEGMGSEVLRRLALTVTDEIEQAGGQPESQGRKPMKGKERAAVASADREGLRGEGGGAEEAKGGA